MTNYKTLSEAKIDSNVNAKHQLGSQRALIFLYTDLKDMT